MLTAQEGFLGLAHGADQQLYGLVDSNSNSFPITGRCDVTPCRLVHIDVAAREVRAELKLRRPLRDVIALRAVPDQKMLIVALSPPGRDAFSTATLDGGYQVVRFDFPGDE